MSQRRPDTDLAHVREEIGRRSELLAKRVAEYEAAKATIEKTYESPGADVHDYFFEQRDYAAQLCARAAEELVSLHLRMGDYLSGLSYLQLARDYISRAYKTRKYHMDGRYRQDEFNRLWRTITPELAEHLRKADAQVIARELPTRYEDWNYWQLLAVFPQHDAAVADLSRGFVSRARRICATPGADSERVCYRFANDLSGFVWCITRTWCRTWWVEVGGCLATVRAVVEAQCRRQRRTAERSALPFLVAVPLLAGATALQWSDPRMPVPTALLYYLGAVAFIAGCVLSIRAAMMAVRGLDDVLKSLDAAEMALAKAQTRSIADWLLHV